MDYNSEIELCGEVRDILGKGWDNQKKYLFLGLSEPSPSSFIRLPGMTYMKITRGILVIQDHNTRNTYMLDEGRLTVDDWDQAKYEMTDRESSSQDYVYLTINPEKILAIEYSKGGISHCKKCELGKVTSNFTLSAILLTETALCILGVDGKSGKYLSTFEFSDDLDTNALYTILENLHNPPVMQIERGGTEDV